MVAEKSHLWQIPTKIKGSSTGNNSLNLVQESAHFLYHAAKFYLPVALLKQAVCQRKEQKIYRIG